MLSKVNLLVDLGYAFDYYSILAIKHSLGFLNKAILDTVQKHLSDQLSSDNFDQIINSKEYNNLYESNKLTFDAVEKARYGNIAAKEVDECNMLRYNAKVNLQRTFAFDEEESNMIEIKS
jgi:hypothetical protein